jgi:Tol biopolymer transport system component
MVTRRDGSHTRLVAPNIDTDLPLGFGPPLPDPWSPDGHWLVFARKDRIYVIHPDASALRRVTAATAYRLAWSPDNKRLAYTGPEGIHVVPVHGGRALRVTTKNTQDSLSWAPSERILYSRRGVIWTVVPGQHPVAIK